MSSFQGVGTACAYHSSHSSLLNLLYAMQTSWTPVERMLILLMCFTMWEGRKDEGVNLGKGDCHEVLEWRLPWDIGAGPKDHCVYLSVGSLVLQHYSSNLGPCFCTKLHPQPLGCFVWAFWFFGNRVSVYNPSCPSIHHPPTFSQ